MDTNWRWNGQRLTVITVMLAFGFLPLHAQYRPVPHRTVERGEIPIDRPGFYGEQGATYVMTNDIVSDRSGIFLGIDVILDLNGYTLTFAEGNYTHIPNSGFERGSEDWGLTKAPGAEIKNTKDVHVFMGDKLLSLKKGDEVVSDYVHLPIANRSYYAMCGITGHHFRDMEGDLANEMKISLFVEDEAGNSVKVTTAYQDGSKVSAPVERKSPRLGGGFIIVHLNNLPSGKYRIRIRADTDCLIDEVDIRPAMDVGVGIVEQTHPFGHYDHLYEIRHSAFFDYTEDVITGQPIQDIPVVKEKGTVTIKNGIIRSGVNGVQSWGIQSTANDAKIIIDNVKVINQGINATAVDVPQALITGCTFEVDNPFLINRHGAQFYAVDLRGDAPSEVSHSEFIGGQGCLVFKGKYSSIHHNRFVNKQMVTNHYSIMAIGDSSYIFENDIEPDIGSGIEVYVHRGMEIFNNRITIESSPPTCEYGSEEYSVAAIRIADYRAEPGSPRSAADNKVYNNKIHVTARDFPEFEEYVPMAWAFFYSASGGDNYIFGNEIHVNHQDPGSKADAAAFYICGGPNGYGGQFYNNKIFTNVPAAWIATRYGGTAHTEVYNNTIIRSPDAPGDLKPYRMGWRNCNSCYAENVVFRSNTYEGMDFGIEMTDQNHSFEVFHTLEVLVTNGSGVRLPDKLISIKNNSGEIVKEGRTDEQGAWEVELQELYFGEGEKVSRNPYLVTCENVSQQIDILRNQTITIRIK